MKIGELGDRCDVTAKTIRYYESIGLLDEPGRTASGNSLLPVAVVVTMDTINALRQHRLVENSQRRGRTRASLRLGTRYQYCG